MYWWYTLILSIIDKVLKNWPTMKKILFNYIFILKSHIKIITIFLLILNMHYFSDKNLNIFEKEMKKPYLIKSSC